MLRHFARRTTRRTSLAIVFILLLALGASLAASPALAMQAQAPVPGPYTVNTTNDTHCTGFAGQGSPNCSAVTDGSGQISLRSALEAANTLGGTTTINLPAGTYNLSLGDLVAGTQANTNITINGTGTPANTTIHQGGAGKLVIVQNYNVNSSVVLQMANVTISGGNENENDPDGFGGDGGAILGGGSATATGVAMIFSGVVFSGNYCSPVANAGCSGGAISMTGGGNLTVSNSTFTGNIASKNSGFGAGGAIYFDNNAHGGNVSITNSTFTNNTAQGNSTTGGQGGAVRLAGSTGSTYTVTTNLFTGNAANGTAAAGAHGGALYLSQGSLTASFNRIVGNTNADSSGLYVANNAGSVGTATNNWWGCNGGPSGGVGCDSALLGTPNQGGSMTITPWIVLSNASNPSPIQVNHATTFTADFLHNSTGGSLTSSQVGLLIGLPVTWGSAVRGALSSQQTSIQSNGTATATFTASAAGAGSATATVDNGAAAGSITINKAGTSTSITSQSLSSTVTGQPFDVNFSVSSNTGTTPTAPTGTVTVSDGTTSCTGSINSSFVGSCSLSPTTAGAKSLTATYNGDLNFNTSQSSAVSHTVSKADTTITITSDNPDPSVVGQSVTINYSVAVTAPGGGTPTGNVTVSDGTLSCTATVADGKCTIAFTSAGAKFLTATYPGDSNYNASPNSAAEPHQVNAADTVTTITSDNPDPSNVGQSVIVVYSVVPTSPGAGTPTGTVTVSDGTISCSATVADGQCSLTFTTSGNKSITATYAGSADFNGSSSAPEPHTVNSAAPSITSADHATFVVGSAGSFTVTTTGSPAPSVSESGALPSGVTFTDNGDGTATLAGTPGAGTGGIYNLVITAHNGVGSDATQNFTLTVNAAPAITSANSTTFVEGQAGSFLVTTTGFPTSSLSESGALPGGVSFVDNGNGTATLSGSASAGSAGSYPLTLTANNGVAPNATQAFTLTVLPPSVQVTIQTSPAGLSFSVDGTPYNSAQTLTWDAGSQHTIATTSPQAGGAGTQYVFNNWSDGGAISHLVSAPATATTYTASFDTQYQLTTSASPSSGGSVTPASGGFYAANAVVNLSATANPGYSFINWTGNVANANSASTTITMSTPQSVTANFTSPTSLLYNGPQIVNLGNSFKPAALLSSPAASCVSNQTITFALDRDPTNGNAVSFPLGSAVTDIHGQATALAVSTSGWQEGIYTITASFAGTTNCFASSYDATLAVAGTGDSASGGGWYTLSGSGRINFGFTVSKTDNTCKSNCAYQGQLLLINNGKWRLKGTLNSYVKTSTGKGAAGGVGDLYWWNTSLNGGLGDWALAASGVSFAANFFDSGKTGKLSTDSFTINIQYTPVAPQPANLPNSNTLQLLKGGDIRVK